MMSQPTLSICMIVRNEEQLLPAALASVQSITDEIVVCVDSRTTDNTREVASMAGARVFDFEWGDNFSKARNFSLSKACMDWILVIDADDRVTSFGRQVIPQCLENLHPDAEGYRLHIGEYTLNGEFIFEDVSTVRLFPRAGCRYVRRIHEQVYINGRQPTLIGSIDGGISIAHVGYDPAHYLKLHKDERNMALLLKSIEDDPTDFYSRYFLAKQHHEMGRDEEAARAARIALSLPDLSTYTDDATLEFLAGLCPASRSTA